MTNARGITQALRGRWHGSYGICLCPAHHNTRTPALSLSDGVDGRLLARCHAGCSFTSILDALKGLSIIDGMGSYTPPDRAIIAQREAEARGVAEKKARQALTVWREALPIEGTIAEHYLRGRGIICPLPDSLRFHPECWRPTAQRLPAMVARVDGAERFAVHRTYLRADGTGKAEVKPAKAMLGRTGGGAVRLTEGAGPLVVAEGIETALSLACGLLGHPARIWAALSSSNFVPLHLPETPARLTIATDSDDRGTSKEAGNKLATRADALGWTVHMLAAPDGHDWNDILMLKGGKK